MGSLAFGWKGNTQGLLQAFELKIPMDHEEVAPEGFRASSPVRAAFAPLPETGPAARGDTILPSRALGQATRHSGLQVLAAALLWRQCPGALPRSRRKCRLKPKAVSPSWLQLARASGEQLGSIWGVVCESTAQSCSRQSTFHLGGRWAERGPAFSQWKGVPGMGSQAALSCLSACGAISGPLGNLCCSAASLPPFLSSLALLPLGL